jgi:hypothetical protein
MTTKNSDHTNAIADSATSADEADTIQNTSAGSPGNVVLTPEWKQLLGKPPLLIGEDETLYWKIFDHMAALEQPCDFVEWVHVKGFVDRHWEAGWHRSAKTELLNLGRKQALADIAHKVIDHKRKDYLEQAHRLSTNWFVDEKVKKEFSNILTLMGLNEDCISAQVLVSNADKYRMLEALDAGTTNRRDGSLRELERRRAVSSSPRGEKDEKDEKGEPAHLVDRHADIGNADEPTPATQAKSTDGGDQS